MRNPYPGNHITRLMGQAMGVLLAVAASLPLSTALVGTVGAEPAALAAADPSRVTPKLLKMPRRWPECRSIFSDTQWKASVTANAAMTPTA